MSELIAHNCDYLVFACVTLTLMVIVHRLALLRVGVDPRAFWHRLGFVALMAITWVLVTRAERDENSRLQATIQGPLPTYAAEMQRMGHALVTPGTPVDDPAYLRMIEAEKRWQRVNPNISDIFTMRRLPDGGIGYVVYAEAEFGGLGDVSPGRDTRAKIGELAQPRMGIFSMASHGIQGMDHQPVSDRWGTWVSAYTPIHNDKGEVEAVLGVNADAAAWQAAIHSARWSTLGWLAAGFIIAAVAAVTLCLRALAHENRRQKQASLQVERSHWRLSSIIHSIDGVVWEWQPENQSYEFVSEQSAEVLGINADAMMKDANQWKAKVHAEDLARLLHERAQAVESDGSYSLDYRLIKAEGQTIWVRERGISRHDRENAAPCVRGIMVDISESRAHAEELEALNKQMVIASRHAGMAEVASGVLHNVGNVLNSVNVSSSVISDIVRESKVEALQKLAQLVSANEPALTEFLTDDPRGRAVPKFLVQLAQGLKAEQRQILTELDDLVKNITHIKQIVMMQQNFARTGGSIEPAEAADMVEDALHMNEAALSRHGVQLRREYDEVKTVLVDRNKVLQILVNLIRNAKHAVQECDRAERRVTIRITQEAEEHVVIEVSDNGMGMSRETLTKLFSYGFTTKKDGHGFGLHSGVNAAREMGGALTACSDGPGKGATFRLELPVMNAELLPVIPDISAASPRPRTRALTSKIDPTPSAALT